MMRVKYKLYKRICKISPYYLFTSDVLSVVFEYITHIMHVYIKKHPHYMGAFLSLLIVHCCKGTFLEDKINALLFQHLYKRLTV